MSLIAFDIMLYFFRMTQGPPSMSESKVKVMVFFFVFYFQGIFHSEFVLDGQAVNQTFQHSMSIWKFIDV
jgi:hypothetical protein